MARQTPEQRRAVAERREAQQERRADIVRMKREGKTYAEIGAHFGVTWQAIQKTYTKALKERPAMEVDELRAEQHERLDDLLRRCYEVLERRHVVVSQGRVVVDDCGDPLVDDDVVLRTLEQIRKIEADRRQVDGTNAVAKQEVNQTVTHYQVDLGDGDAAREALT